VRISRLQKILEDMTAGMHDFELAYWALGCALASDTALA
jgi:hypothetical protein